MEIRLCPGSVQLILGLTTTNLWHLIDNCWTIADNFQDFMFQLLQDSNQPIRSRIGVVLWCIWKARNTKLWEETSTPPTVAFNNA
ncbi:hypothetical protein JHK87_048155 [Glycine soja]|nr:hypothetical protein JHK87_048155 [Glycine soja]